jgi:hypothetical protein
MPRIALSKAILRPLLHPSQWNSKKNDTLYVALSQVKHLIDLQVLEPLSHSFLKYFQPRKAHLIEDIRLQA